MQFVFCNKNKYINTIMDLVILMFTQKGFKTNLSRLMRDEFLMLENETLVVSPINYDKKKLGFYFDMVFIKQFNHDKRRNKDVNRLRCEIYTSFSAEPPVSSVKAEGLFNIARIAVYRLREMDACNDYIPLLIASTNISDESHTETIKEIVKFFNEVFIMHMNTFPIETKSTRITPGDYKQFLDGTETLFMDKPSLQVC